MKTFHIISLFPESFESYFGSSIIKRAIEDKKIKIKYYNPRDFTKDKNHRVDQKPYGGGPGMVIEALPVIKAVKKAKGQKKKVKIFFLSPGGKQFDTKMAKNVASKFNDFIFICGRYEGIDVRVKKVFKVEEISVGPFVVTGGELPTMIMIDTISRQIRGVLGDIDSLEENRVSSHDVYTRPETFEYMKKKYSVPKVLVSGHHKEIEKWKKGEK
ncbi:tRNA (guanosine(37)-N1)-methyltransferase TrmD [Candidatus Nomurabacteria bacterium]|nr:tRNA (guanosine(37)-N1)-methyltransferase TrmD [Candidatus Nomurabacteria bacterium]